MSALKAIGEQFGGLPPASVSATAGDRLARRPPPEREAVLDEATRENRKAAERFLDRVLTAAEASVRLREERAHYAAQDGVHVTLVAGYDDWRDDARRALDGCRRILDDPETFDRHLARRPGAEDELRHLSSCIETGLKADSAEIERVRQEKRSADEAGARSAGEGAGATRRRRPATSTWAWSYEAPRWPAPSIARDPELPGRAADSRNPTAGQSFPFSADVQTFNARVRARAQCGGGPPSPPPRPRQRGPSASPAAHPRGRLAS